MTVKYVTTVRKYTGLSTDTKPTTVPVGSTFYEYDTNYLWITYDGTNWSLKTAGSFTATGTIDLHQAASTYDLFTATSAGVVVEYFSITLPNIDVTDDTAITSISVVTDTTSVITLLSAANGAKANLTANASFTYSTPFTLPATKKIRLVLAGGTADADPTTCTTLCRYMSIAPAGYLA